MQAASPEAEIARQVKAVEWLKAELLVELGKAYRGATSGNRDEMLDGLANCQVLLSILARRLGIDLQTLDDTVDAKLAAHQQQGHSLERWFGDFTAVRQHRRGGKR